MFKPFIKKHKKKLIIASIFFCCLIVLSLLILRFSTLQEKLIFPSPKANEEKYAKHIKERNPITHYIKMSDGIVLHGFQYKNRAQDGAKQRKTIIFFGGNTKNVIKSAPMTAMLLETGYDVCCIDYRGYGKSTGRMKKEEHFSNDATAVYEYFQKKDYKQKNMILCGYSLGGSAAHYVGASPNHAPAGMITIGTFKSLPEAKLKGKWFFNLILRYKLNNAEMISKIACPILILHGKKDKLVPIENGEYLYKKAKKTNKNVCFVKYDGEHGGFLKDAEIRKKIRDSIISFCDMVTDQVAS